MTRRKLLLTAIRPPVVTRNDVSTAGNAFHDLWREWTADWNGSKDGGISATEPDIFERMCKAFNEFRKKRTAWLRGL